MKITHERVLELVSYEPVTGIFRNKVRRGRLEVGQILDSLNITLDYEKICSKRLAWFYVHKVWPEIPEEPKVKLPSGVSKVNAKPGWYKAQICYNYMIIYLGMYPTPEEAHEVFKKKHVELHRKRSKYFKG